MTPSISTRQSEDERHPRPARWTVLAKRLDGTEYELEAEYAVQPTVCPKCGSLGHMAGLSQRQIADMLGHSSMKTTERYLHGYQQDAARGVDIVAAQIQGAWKAPADD